MLLLLFVGVSFSSVLPIGSVIGFAGSTNSLLPTGWARCHGQLLSVENNPALFQALGTAFGGDGRTTFGLPDLRGRTPYGEGVGPESKNVSMGAKGGLEKVTLLSSNTQHRHNWRGSSEDGTVGSPAGAILASSDQEPLMLSCPNMDLSFAGTTLTGASQPHNNMQPFVGMNFIISLVPQLPLPVGAVVASVRGQVPPRFVAASGEALPVTSTFGTRFGALWNDTAPPLIDRILVGAGLGAGLTARTLGEMAGERNVALSIANLPSHNHKLLASTEDATMGEVGNDTGVAVATGAEKAYVSLAPTETMDPRSYSQNIGAVSGSPEHNNLMPTFFADFLVALEKVDEIPVGLMVWSASQRVLPNSLHFRKCDGSAYSTGTNPELVGALDAKYSLTLPDVQGRVIAGNKNSLGQTLGSAQHVLSEAELPAHSHLILVSDDSASAEEPTAGSYLATANVDRFVTGEIPDSRLCSNPLGLARTPHPNEQPYVGLGVWMIAATITAPPQAVSEGSETSITGSAEVRASTSSEIRGTLSVSANFTVAGTVSVFAQGLVNVTGRLNAFGLLVVAEGGQLRSGGALVLGAQSRLRVSLAARQFQRNSQRAPTTVTTVVATYSSVEGTLGSVPEVQYAGDACVTASAPTVTYGSQTLSVTTTLDDSACTGSTTTAPGGGGGGGGLSTGAIVGIAIGGAVVVAVIVVATVGIILHRRQTSRSIEMTRSKLSGLD